MSFSESTQARNETDPIGAQNGADVLLGELFEGFDLALPDDAAAEEAKRSELYAVVASIFA